MSDPYAAYPSLELDRPASGVLRLTLRAAGRLNAVSGAMHGELAAVWRTYRRRRRDAGRDRTRLGRRIQRRRRPGARRRDRPRPGGATPCLPRGARPRLQPRLLSEADRLGDDRPRGRRRARGRPARRHLDRDAVRTHHRRPHEARSRGGRPRGPRLAAALRPRQGEVPPPALRAARRSRGGADRPGLAVRPGRGARARAPSRSRHDWPAARSRRSATPSSRSTTGSVSRVPRSTHRWRSNSSTSRARTSARASPPCARSARPRSARARRTRPSAGAAPARGRRARSP